MAGQEGVLGRPETASQGKHILDSSRGLEEPTLREDIKPNSLDILGIQPQVIVLTALSLTAKGRCATNASKNPRRENAWVLRVPFQNSILKSPIT